MVRRFETAPSRAHIRDQAQTEPSSHLHAFIQPLARFPSCAFAVYRDRLYAPAAFRGGKRWRAFPLFSRCAKPTPPATIRPLQRRRSGSARFTPGSDTQYPHALVLAHFRSNMRRPAPHPASLGSTSTPPHERAGSSSFSLSTITRSAQSALVQLKSPSHFVPKGNG